MEKFNRNYSLSVRTNEPAGLLTGNFINIELPFTIEFETTRTVYGGANTFSIRIYNLNENTRSKLIKDYWTFSVNRKVILYAGYGELINLQQVLTGFINQCWSVREGVNFITEIQGTSVGFAFSDAFSSGTYGNGATYKSVIEKVAQDYAKFGIDVGEIGRGYNTSVPQGKAYCGRTKDVISGLVGNSAFVDNFKLNCISDNEVLKTVNVSKIDASTGLLGTPVRNQSVLVFETLFDPNLVPGQLVSIKSGTEKAYNGNCKIMSVNHKGMISPAVCGSLISKVTVQYLPTPLNANIL